MQTVAATIAARKSKSGKGEWFSEPHWPPFNVVIPDIPRPYMGWRSGMIGIEAEGVDGELARYFGVKEGVLVRAVIKGSPAEKAGLKAGDVITKVDGNGVGGPRELTKEIRSREDNKAIPITVMRDRTEMGVTIEVRKSRQ